MSQKGRQDLQLPPARRTESEAEEASWPEAAEVAGSERRLEEMLFRHRFDEDKIVEHLRRLPAMDWRTARVVAIRQLGAQRAGALCGTAFGEAGRGRAELVGVRQAAVQMKRLDGRGEDEADQAHTRELALRGLGDAAAPLPFADTIQPLFGRHPIAGVRAHVGGAAADAARSIGAKAYAVGDDIAFSEAPDLFVAAHEAAHAVQQRAGLHPSGGIGAAGDALERQADAAAEAVVRGASAEAILGAPAATGASGVTATPAATAATSPAAVSVQRLSEAKYKGLDPVAAVGKALKDDSTADAHELMRKLDGEQSTAVLAHYQKDATSCFNNDTMGTAAWILVRNGGRLDLALEWMFDEGTNWRMLRSVIEQCTFPGFKNSVRTTRYRDLFVGELGNDEMAALVDLLDGPIDWKLSWMFEEGTDYEHVSAKISAAKAKGQDLTPLCTDTWRKYFISKFGNDEIGGLVQLLPLKLEKKLVWMKDEGTDWKKMQEVILGTPEADRPPVYDEPGLLKLFVSECNNKEMYAAVKLLGGPLVKQLAWMTEEGCDDDWMKERVTRIVDAGQRTDVYANTKVKARLREIDADPRIEIIKLLAGTPQQQMEVFGNDIPIEKLIWVTPTADWVDGLVKSRKSPLDLLELAKGNPAAWGPLVQPRLWDLLQNWNDTLYPEARVTVFWAAYGDGMLFDSPKIMHFVKLLCGVEPVKGGETITHAFSTDYKCVNPDDATARQFMEILRPGGSSGALGIARGELGKGRLAFASEVNNGHGWEPIGTSYFHAGDIIIAVDGTGHMSTVHVAATSTGDPSAVGTALTYFQNHVRHEIGHAVGQSKIGSMSESGNAFAEAYGGWQSSSKSDFLSVMWTGAAKPAAGWPALVFGRTSVTVTDDLAKEWAVGIFSSAEEKNEIGAATGATIQQKITVLAGSLWSGQPLLAYMKAIIASAAGAATDPKAMQDSAYQFAGFAPATPVRMYSTRFGHSFATYSKDAYDQLHPISWYALSSPVEMFAEMYTARYAGMALPGPVNGKDPNAFFTQLEAQRDPMFGK